MVQNKRPFENKETNDEVTNYDDNRLKRAKIILQQVNPIKKIAKGFYLVKSQSKRGWYQVAWCGDKWCCECNDYIKRQKPCKHILVLQLYFSRFVSIEGKKIEPPRKKYPRNWSKYNQAQKNERQYLEKFLGDLVKTVKEPERSRGRPSLKVSDALFCCILKVYNKIASRKTGDLIKKAYEANYISHNANHNCISKTLLNPEITPVLQDLVLRSASPLRDVETDFAVDSSGFRCSSFGAYNGERYIQNKTHNWIKVHVSIGVITNIIAGAVITSEHKGDSPQFYELFRQTRQNFKPNEIYGDAAYCTQSIYDNIDDKGAMGFLLFRRNITGSTIRSEAMKKALKTYQNQPNMFLRRYHRRENVETTFNSLKTMLGEAIKSKKFTSQKNEMLCKIIAYNITRLIHAKFELEIPIEFNNGKN